MESKPRRYWYDEKRNAIWPFDGTYGGDECVRLLVDVEDVEAMLQPKIDFYKGPPPGVTKPSKLPPPPPRQK